MLNKLRSLTALVTLIQASMRAPRRPGHESAGQTRTLKVLCVGAVLPLILVASTVQVAAAEPLDAVASDPKQLEWMIGFPPPADKVIAYPSSNYFSFPRLRWTFCPWPSSEKT